MQKRHYKPNNDIQHKTFKQFKTPKPRKIIVLHPLKKARKMKILIDADTLKAKMIKYGFHAVDMTVTEFVEEIVREALKDGKKKI